MKLKVLAIASFICLSTVAQTTQDLDLVTVTASIVPEKQSRTGRNILVIKGDRFQHLPVNSLDELLRYLPGIEVQARGPMGSQSDIVLRGGTFQQVLVLVDGLRVNDPNTGHFSTYIPIAPSEIERIEVLKGASSAIYGSEAVGGVVHVITKSFSRQTTPVTTASLQLAAGEYGLMTIQGGFFHKGQKTAIGGGIISNNADGQPQRGANGFFNNHTASLSVSHFLDDQWQLCFRSAYDDRHFAAQNFYTSFLSDTASERVKTLWNQLQVSHISEKNNLKFSVGYKDLDDQYSFNSVAIPNHNKSKMWQSFVANEHKLLAGSVITTGIQYINKSIRSNDRGNHQLNQAGIFAILNQQVGERLNINPALRAEYNERSGWEWVPQFNTSYQLQKFTIRASAGKTIRDADFTERFNNYNKPIVNSGRIGNEALVAERSFSYEAGVDYMAWSAFKISAGFFTRDQTRLIDYVPTPYAEMPRKQNLNPAGNFALAKNIASVRTSGAEVDLLYQKTFSSGQQLWTTLGLVWLDSKSSETSGSLYLSSHARFLGNFNIRYEKGIFAIGINGIYKQRASQESTSPAIVSLSNSYLVFNTKLEASLFNKKLFAFIQADNMLDKPYADLLGSQMPGRWLMGGIKISLTKLSHARHI